MKIPMFEVRIARVPNPNTGLKEKNQSGTGLGTTAQKATPKKVIHTQAVIGER
jgi:hypothetical protein